MLPKYSIKVDCNGKRASVLAPCRNASVVGFFRGGYRRKSHDEENLSCSVLP